MNIDKIKISNDPDLYEAWPDVAIAQDGRLVCVFSECTHHDDRSYTRIMQSESFDQGRTWSQKHPITEGTKGLPYFYNCARISRLKNGHLAVVVDKIPREGEWLADKSQIVIRYSCDNGDTYSEPQALPLCGIVPDKICELDTGRMIASAHKLYQGKLAQFLRYSDDHGKTWSTDVLVAFDHRYNLCEVSLLPLGDGVIVALLRENTCVGIDCLKAVSHDNGETWGPLVALPLPGCHRPVSGLLDNGQVLITYRFIQGGAGRGFITQNFFGALTDTESLLTIRRNDARVRIFPIDYDASPVADLGYSGWVQLNANEVYIVNYIVDDAFDKGQIRGYLLKLNEILVKR